MQSPCLVIDRCNGGLYIICLLCWIPNSSKGCFNLLLCGVGSVCKLLLQNNPYLPLTTSESLFLNSPCWVCGLIKELLAFFSFAYCQSCTFHVILTISSSYCFRKFQSLRAALTQIPFQMRSLMLIMYKTFPEILASVVSNSIFQSLKVSAFSIR